MPGRNDDALPSGRQPRDEARWERRPINAPPNGEVRREGRQKQTPSGSRRAPPAVRHRTGFSERIAGSASSRGGGRPKTDRTGAWAGRQRPWPARCGSRRGRAFDGRAPRPAVPRVRKTPASAASDVGCHALSREATPRGDDHTGGSGCEGIRAAEAGRPGPTSAGRGSASPPSARGAAATKRRQGGGEVENEPGRRCGAAMRWSGRERAASLE